MAQPTPKAISQLDAAGPLSGAEQLAGVQDTRTKKITVDQIKEYSDTSCQCTLFSRYNAVGTDAVTTKKYLQTYTLPAETLPTDGSWLQIHAAGTFAANGNTKLVSVGIKQTSTGLNQLSSTPSFAFNDDTWSIDLRVQRSSASSYVIYKHVTVTDNAATLQTPGELQTIGDVSSMSWLQDLQITVEGTNSTASANDIVCNSFIGIAHLLDTNS